MNDEKDFAHEEYLNEQKQLGKAISDNNDTNNYKNQTTNNIKNSVKDTNKRISEKKIAVQEKRASDFLFIFVGFLLPIVGIVLFFIWKNKYPVRAKYCIIGAVISFILYFFSYCSIF